MNCCGVIVSPATARRMLGHRADTGAPALNAPSSVPIVGSVIDAATWTPERDELVAIDEYVRNQRPKIPQFPKLQPLIESWEAWYGALDVIDLSPLKSADTLAEAKRRKRAINVAMSNTLPATWVPADGAQTPPEQPHHDLDPLAALKTGAAIAGALAVGYVVLKFL